MKSNESTSLKSVYTKILMEAPNYNDPVLQNIRAKTDKRKSYGPKPSSSQINHWYTSLEKMYAKMQETLQLERDLHSEMDSDPDIELDGGTVADAYGAQLNDLDLIKQKIRAQIQKYEAQIQKYNSTFL